MSLRNMQYQQQPHSQVQHFQQQHPLLALASGNNFAYTRGRYAGHANGYRTLAGDGTSARGVYAGSSPSGYGTAPSASASGYDYHPQGPPPPPAHPPQHHPIHVPSGGGYSYHAAPATGYGPPQVPVHPQPQYPPAAKKMKSGGSSAVTALTLLSFFFFVNLLQGCLKDHMDALNPTVMVMTANVARSRFNKLAEMNSREQSSSSPASINGGGFSSGASIVMQPADLVASAASVASSVAVASPATATSTIQLQQSPYNDNGKPPTATHFNYNGNNNQFSNTNKDHNYESSPAFYDSNSYPNQTLHSVISNDKRYNYHQQEQQQQQHQAPQKLPHYSTAHDDSTSSWPYGSSLSSSSTSSASASTSLHRKHHGSSSAFSSWATARPNRISGSNYFDVEDDDNGGSYRRGEPYYTRIN